MTEKTEKAVLKVDGMSCEHCVKAVTRAAETVPSVKNVRVDLKGGTVAFDYDAAKAALAAVKAAIEDQGYDIGAGA